ncbi:MAG: endonuclease/exonuclease/phosphatase family protein [Actinomycetota bacterium]
MDVTVGTFNLNNLFSRFNFEAEVSELGSSEKEVTETTTYRFDDPSTYRMRTFMGRLVKGKDARDTEAVATRILRMDLDVLAAQEVEDIDTLRRFNRENLHNLYAHAVLVEGNDTRLIDVAVLSKLPIGRIVSWQTAVNQADPGRPAFSRDLLEVEILSASRAERLFTLFVNHLKSHFVSPPETDDDANSRRLLQAETVAYIVSKEMRPDSSFLVVGDMNDPPTSPYLAPMTAGLVDGLASPQETHPPKPDDPPPPSVAWTHRFKESGKPARYELFDHVWLSPALARRQTEAWIDRRVNLTGDGSDHDPAWVRLEV